MLSNQLTRRTVVRVGASVAAFALIATPLLVAAQVDVSTCSNLRTLVERITRALGFIALLAAAIVVIVGAFYLVFGGGSDTAAGKGRQLIIYGLVGVAVSLIAFTLPQLVINILGATAPACP